MLESLATQEVADNDGLDSLYDVSARLEDRRTFITHIKLLLDQLTSNDARMHAQAMEQAEVLHESMNLLAAETEVHDARVSTAAVQAANTANQGTMTSIAIVFSVLVFLIGFTLVLLQWRIIRPLRTLEAASGALATNQFAADIPVTHNDEISAVQRAFNHMARTLRAQTQDLTQQVAIATQARAETESANATIRTQLAEIDAQRLVIRDMSVPILPVSPTTLVMPLIGVLDTERLQLMQHQVLATIARVRAHYLLVDITGVPLVDTQVAQGIVEVVRAARLLGVEVVLVGVRPEVAQTIVGLGLSLGHLITRSTLESGIAYVLEQQAPVKAAERRVAHAV
jgi:rsbT co-antagonist protein RsbR